MYDLWKTGRELRAVLTSGWISSYELSRLDRGSFISGFKEVGEPVSLELDGSFIASCEIVVFGEDAVLGAQITSLDCDDATMTQPERGDEITELLPFKICLPQSRYSLAELEHAGIGTIVSLDTAFPDDLLNTNDVELCIFGSVVARGKFVVSGEKVGIVIDELMSKSPVSDSIRSTGSLIRADRVSANTFKHYDFRRPDRFDRPSIRAAWAIHDRIPIEELHPSLRGYKLKLIDQMTWGEWVEDFPVSSPIASFDAHRHKRIYEKETNSTQTPIPIIAPSNARFPLNEKTMTRSSEWMDGMRDYDSSSPVIVAATGSAEIPDDAVMGKALRSAWKTITDIGFHEPIRHEKAPVRQRTGDGDTRGINGDEMVLLASFEADDGKGHLHIVYTSRVLAPLVRVLRTYGKLGL